MTSTSNCVPTIIFIAIFICVWRLDCPNATARVLFRHGANRFPSYPNAGAEKDKMANYGEKGHQKESIESEQGMGDFEHDFQENIQHSKGRSVIEEKRRQAGQNSMVIAATGGSLFVVALVLTFCARRTEDEEQTQEDERVGLTQTQTQTQTGKIENSEVKDLENGGPSFKHYDTNKVKVGDEDGGGTPPPPGPPPPPPPKARPPPASPFRGGRAPPPPPKGANQRTHSGGEGNEYDGQRTRLKPFFWDKVLASPEHSMVWDEIKAGSFQFNEEMIESLFGYNPDERKISDRRGRQANSPTTFIQIIDSRKAQNLSILLKALNVTTEEVHDALIEGHELPAELLQTLIRMAPTSEEELKLRLYSGDVSQIGTAERFLKSLVEIPFAFRRMECLLFIMSIKEEASGLKEAFSTLEVASNRLRSSRLFLKILEAVLKTGNRMNDGTYRGGAQAFKLDTLLKLADVKGADGKTTLLHFVIQEIIRTEGVKLLDKDVEQDDNAGARALGLRMVSKLSSELEVIRKAAVLDSDALTSSAAKLGQSLVRTKEFLNREMQHLGEQSRFYLALRDFVEEAEGEITWLLEEERRVMELVRKTIDYFHGSSTREEGLRLFVVVRDFLTLLDRICVEIQHKMDDEAAKHLTTASQQKEALRTKDKDVIQDMRNKLIHPHESTSTSTSTSTSSDADDHDHDHGDGDESHTSTTNDAPAESCSQPASHVDSKQINQEKLLVHHRLFQMIQDRRFHDSSSSSNSSSGDEN